MKFQTFWAAVFMVCMAAPSFAQDTEEITLKPYSEYETWNMKRVRQSTTVDAKLSADMVRAQEAAKAGQTGVLITYLERAMKQAKRIYKRDPGNIQAIKVLRLYARVHGQNEWMLAKSKNLVAMRYDDEDVHRETVKWLVDADMHEDAVIYLKGCEEQFGPQQWITTDLRSIYFLVGQLDDGLKVVEDFMFLPGQGDNGGDLYLMSLMKVGRNEEAYISGRQLVKRYPEDLDIRVSMIQASQRVGARDTADAYMRKVIADNQADDDWHIWYMQFMMEDMTSRLAAEDSSARDDLLQLAKWGQWEIDRRPNQAAFHGLLAEVFDNLDSASISNEYWRKSTTLEEGYRYVYHRNLVRTDWVLDQWDTMIVDVQAAIEIHPKESYLHIALAHAYEELEDFDAAISVLEEAQDEFWDDDNVLITIGMSKANIYRELNDAKSLASTMEPLIDDYPSVWLLYNNYAYFLTEMDQDLKKALKMIRKVPYEELDASMSDTKAWVYFKLEKYEKAQQWIDHSLELAEDPGFTLYDHAGDIYAALNLIESAIEYYELALASDLEDVDEEEVEATRAKLEAL